MRKIFMQTLLVCLILCAPLSMSHICASNTLCVGGDLSMVAAYEQAGDQWLDENGNPIPDLITYVRDKGWNLVRLRLFLDPSQDSDPSTLQDYAYTLALARRVKEANMQLMLDFHYSDTWADPSTQRIPAIWTDHSAAALAAQLYRYSHDIVTDMIAHKVVPDYVQLGNEITYGLLWDTTDGTYPKSSSQYVAAGYCPTWSATYSDGTTQWRRTASLLNNAAHGVRTAFHEAGLDSTAVQLVVHTEMGSSQRNTDNFYRHLRTAGFTNYDVIGLSYYPFWHGPLTMLTSLLATLAADFPDKPVHIVETAWYNNWYPSDADYTIAQLNSKWTANGAGIGHYLTDLIAAARPYSNLTGIVYWMPEECGNGYQKTLMRGWINRGLWYSSTGQRHTLAIGEGGLNPVSLLASFATATDGIGTIGEDAPVVGEKESMTFDLSGRRQSSYSKGIRIRRGKKFFVK